MQQCKLKIEHENKKIKLGHGRFFVQVKSEIEEWNRWVREIKRNLITESRSVNYLPRSSRFALLFSPSLPKLDGGCSASKRLGAGFEKLG